MNCFLHAVMALLLVCKRNCQDTSNNLFTELLNMGLNEFVISFGGYFKNGRNIFDLFNCNLHRFLFACSVVYIYRFCFF